jgi:hypothetical protein
VTEVSAAEDRQGFRKALMSAARLGELLSRVPLDYEALLRPVNEAALVSAAGICRHCDHSAACARWITRHEDGEANRPLSLCPVIAGLGRLAGGELLNPPIALVRHQTSG